MLPLVPLFKKILWSEKKRTSHNARFFEPYPFYSIRARGKYIWDIDQNRYVDYWMGHTSLILGHSPNVVTKELRKQIGNGLLLGTANKYAVELSELVNACVPSAELVRFCTTGAEATMYAVRLARARTRRKDIIKIAGGWHGYSSALTVGVSYPYNKPESAGLLETDESHVRLARFNDIANIRKVMSIDRKQVAAVIVEPVLGAGGVIPADRDYLRTLREECDRVGALLIFDEIITGFRLALGGAQEYYRVKPDICTLGKILGGGLPSSCIAGSRETMSLADTTVKRTKEERCWIGGGTFSEHALAMLSGIATIKFLRERKGSIYSDLDKRGKLIRSNVDKAFSENGIHTETTGICSLFSTHFLRSQNLMKSPEDVRTSKRNLEYWYYFSLIADHSIFFLPGHIGALSTEHTEKDIEHFVKSTESVAKKLRAIK